mgnify:FL=1
MGKGNEEPIPGTDLQICFGELDSPDIMEKMKAYMVPNAADNGIDGISEAIVKGNFSEEAWAYIQKLFSNAQFKGNCLTYDMGTTRLAFQFRDQAELSVELKAVTSNKEIRGKSFEVENVKITL